LSFSDEGRSHQLLNARIKEYAKNIIDTRVAAYIETFKELEKYPDHEDVEKLIDESKPYVLSKVKI
jgi:hypothetical protein